MSHSTCACSPSLFHGVIECYSRTPKARRSSPPPPLKLLLLLLPCLLPFLSQAELHWFCMACSFPFSLPLSLSLPSQPPDPTEEAQPVSKRLNHNKTACPFLLLFLSSSQHHGNFLGRVERRKSEAKEKERKRREEAQKAKLLDTRVTEDIHKAQEKWYVGSAIIIIIIIINPGSEEEEEEEEENKNRIKKQKEGSPFSPSRIHPPPVCELLASFPHFVHLLLLLHLKNSPSPACF